MMVMKRPFDKWIRGDMPQWRAWEAGVCPLTTGRSAAFRLGLWLELPGI